MSQAKAPTPGPGTTDSTLVSPKPETVIQGLSLFCSELVLEHCVCQTCRVAVSELNYLLPGSPFLG